MSELRQQLDELLDGRGIVTKFAVTAEVLTPGGERVLAHRSGDLDDQPLNPWDEAMLHRAGMLTAEDVLRRNTEEAEPDD